jgi:hypothetical protein
MIHISIPTSAKDKAECVIKNTQLGGVGDKFKAWNKTYSITAVKTVLAKDASKFHNDCGFESSLEWKREWMRTHLFPPNPQDVMFAHYFEEVE